jgi:hypothetical protein
MAWRPTEYLIEGELDNTNPGKVIGMDVVRRHEGQNDVRPERQLPPRHSRREDPLQRGRSRWAMTPRPPTTWQAIASHQTGDVGDITAGLPPHDYVASCRTWSGTAMTMGAWSWSRKLIASK